MSWWKLTFLHLLVVAESLPWRRFPDLCLIVTTIMKIQYRRILQSILIKSNSPFYLYTNHPTAKINNYYSIIIMKGK
jgi:hypothetical protein